jgi:hypothetical protein
MITCAVKCSSLGYLELKGGPLNHGGTINGKGKYQADFFLMPKKNQQKFVETHKTLPDDRFPLICFFKQCQNADCASRILNQLQEGQKAKP